MSPLKGLLFDLDGTVLDTRELIYRSFEYVRQVVGLPAVPRAELIRCWGEPLGATISRWAPDDSERLLQIYREYMYLHHDDLVQPFAGIEEVLLDFDTRGIPLGIVTSKIRRGTERGLIHTELDKYFNVVVTVEDTARPKPYPDPALLAAAKLGLGPEELLFVGDTVHDIHCANSAGCTSVAVMWSECSEEELLQACPDYLIHQPGELLNLFTNISPKPGKRTR